MSRADAHIALYDLVADMTIANGYNYDWQVRYDIEKSAPPKPNGKAMLTIELGDETNQDDIGGAGAGQYIDLVQVLMTASVATAETDSKMSSIAYDQSIACSLAISDIKKMFNNAPLQDDLCTAGVHDLHYTGATIEVVENADKYTGKRAICTFDMQYRSER
jgi:hypothetical protein